MEGRLGGSIDGVRQLSANHACTSKLSCNTPAGLTGVAGRSTRHMAALTAMQHSTGLTALRMVRQLYGGRGVRHAHEVPANTDARVCLQMSVSYGTQKRTETGTSVPGSCLIR